MLLQFDLPASRGSQSEGWSGRREARPGENSLTFDLAFRAEKAGKAVGRMPPADESVAGRYFPTEPIFSDGLPARRETRWRKRIFVVPSSLALNNQFVKPFWDLPPLAQLRDFALGNAG
jgi:hypothetical protein